MMAVSPKQSVASELLVNDRTLVVPAPPLSLTTSGDLVWIALSDGKVEVRNARTGEVVRRFEPAHAAVTARVSPGTTAMTSTNVAGSSTTTAGILSSLTNHVLPGSLAATGSGAAAGAPTLEKCGDEAPLPAPALAQVRSLLAVPIANGTTHVWLGLSDGMVEVHEGGDLLHNSVGAASGSVSSSFLAVLRKHTAAVTCFAEFGGYVYSGSEDQRIVQWRATHSSFVNFFTSQSPHQGPVRCLYAEGNAVVSGSTDGTVKVWDVGEGTMRLTGYFHSRSGGVLSLCRVGELMWSGDAAGQVVRWHIRTCEAVAMHKPHCDRVLSLCHVGDRVYSGSADGTMGVFDAQSGQLLQQITDQALGWVTTVLCPAELSRFVVWSASADGAVRCWYQDEYVTMSADEFRFNDPSWYESGSTPYREFRAAVGQRTSRLKRQLEVVEQRDQQTMALLHRCSTVFGGGGADFVVQQRRLEEQLEKAEERCTAAQARLAQKREAAEQLDRDIAATVAQLQSTKSELNLLMPGEAERILATMPAGNAEDLVLNGQTPPPPSAAPAPPPPSTAPPSTYTTGTTIPVGPPPVLAPLPPPPPPPPTTALPVAVPVTPPPPAATLSTLGVGGPLSTAPAPAPPLPPPPPAVVVVVPPPSAGAAETQAPNPPPPPPPVPATAAAPSPALPSVPSVGTAASPTPAAAPTKLVDDTVRWTNPHVGNYIQRRYYGASPSLRTTDLMKQERQRGRLPRVKVVPLQRTRSHSAATSDPTKSCSSSVVEKSVSVKETATTTTATTATTTAKPATST
jgi:WD40 repeat protein